MLSIFANKNVYANITICNEETYEQLMPVIHVPFPSNAASRRQRKAWASLEADVIALSTSVHYIKTWGRNSTGVPGTACLQKSHWPHFLFFWERLRILQHPGSGAAPAFAPCLPRESNFGWDERLWHFSNQTLGWFPVSPSRYNYTLHLFQAVIFSGLL